MVIILGKSINRSSLVNPTYLLIRSVRNTIAVIQEYLINIAVMLRGSRIAVF